MKHDWGAAFDQCADEKDKLWDCLNNILELWKLEAPTAEMENAMVSAAKLLEETDAGEL